MNTRWLTLLAVVLCPLGPAHGAEPLGPELEITALNTEQYPRIECTFALTRGNEAVLGLGIQDISAHIDGHEVTRVALRSSGSSGDRVDVLLLVDVSGSMRGQRAEQMRQAAQDLVARLRLEDRVRVVAFNHRLVTLIDWTPKGQVRKIAIPVDGRGGTRLLDSLGSALQSFPPDSTRRAVVVLTDGHDTRSRLRPDALAKAARKTGTAVFCITPGGSGDAKLRHLAEETGGALYASSRTDDLQSIYQRIAARLAGTYSLTVLAPASVRGRPVQRSEITARLGSVGVTGRREFWSLSQPSAPASTDRRAFEPGLAWLGALVVVNLALLVALYRRRVASAQQR